MEYGYVNWNNCCDCEHTIILGQGKTLHHFHLRTSRFQKSLFPSATNGWNSLDLNVRNSVSLPTFKAKLRSTLFPCCYNKWFHFSFSWRASIYHTRLRAWLYGLGYPRQPSPRDNFTKCLYESCVTEPQLTPLNYAFILRRNIAWRENKQIRHNFQLSANSYSKSLSYQLKKHVLSQLTVKILAKYQLSVNLIHTLRVYRSKYEYKGVYKGKQGYTRVYISIQGNTRIY